MKSAFRQADIQNIAHSSTNIDVREGASGASADAPGVGLEMVSDLKLLQKDENKWKNQRKDKKMTVFYNAFIFEQHN